MVSDLMVDNHFARCREILNKRGLLLLAEGGHPRVDPLKALGASDIPMGEFWNNGIVGDLQPGVKEAIARTNMKPKFKANSPLLPSGLIDLMKLVFPFTKTVSLD